MAISLVSTQWQYWKQINLLCKGQKYKESYSAWFYREKVVANEQRFIFQARTICNKDNCKGV